ncbi:MAG: leucine-rich repeat domain-containing protein [Acidimicrobiia bacterium]
MPASSAALGRIVVTTLGVVPSHPVAGAFDHPSGTSDRVDLSRRGLTSVPEWVCERTDIVDLDLSGNELTALPDAIGGLTKLTRLRLAGNQLRSVPAPIGELARLTRLDLDRNQLDTLPATMAALSRLRTIRLTSNRFAELPDALAGLGRLTGLFAGGNRLLELPTWIGALTNLTGLYLGGNQLSSLPESIGALVHLATLDLGRNVLERLPESLGDLAGLVSLDAGGNRVRELPASVGRLGRLTAVDLSHNRLAALPSSIGDLASLRSLYLSGNELERLPPGVCALSGLERLYVADNRLEELPEGIGGLAALTTLALGGNRLVALPSSVGRLRSLATLSVRFNRLTSLPDSIGELAALTQLDAGGNELSQLPESIGRLANLASLRLGFNRLTALPGTIGRLQGLVHLRLRFNHLRSLPHSMGDLAGLRNLDIGGNELTELPGSLGRLARLTRLDAGRNRLDRLPGSIDGLVALTSLNVASNQLTELPSSFGGVARLRYLHLGDNPLGVAPPAIDRLPALHTLRLDHCDLAELPAWIGKAAKLRTLSLSGNRLQDLPAALAGLPALEELYVGDSHGGCPLARFPAVLTRMGTLRILTLAHCGLRQVPAALDRLDRLRRLDLTGNRLTELPASLARLSALESLELGQNPLEPSLEAAAALGLDELRSYLRRLASEGEVFHRGKVVLVGAQGAGKTLLLSALAGERDGPEPAPTRGVDVRVLRLPHPTEPVDLELRVWELGGDPRDRPTNLRFYTAPAVYVVVWAPRGGPEPGAVDRWCRLVRYRAGTGVRVLVVATHRADARLARLAEGTLRAAHGDLIAGFFHVDSRSGEGIDELRAALAAAVVELYPVARAYPRSWRRARAWIAQTAAATPYLSYVEFLAGIERAGVPVDAARSFTGHCHQLGLLMHFDDDPGLADLVVLRPDWFTKAVSLVLDDDATAAAGGLITHRRLASVWDDAARPADERYPADTHSPLLRLMERFGISYRVAGAALVDRSSGVSLIAQIVPAEASIEGVWDDEVPTGLHELVEEIESVEVPSGRPAVAEGLLHQLIARFNRLSLGRRDYRRAVHWQSGIVLDDGGHGRALLTVADSRLRVSVRAAYPRLLLGRIVDEVHRTVQGQFRGLTTVRGIPCTAPCGRGAPGSGLFDIERLVRERDRGRREFPCSSCDEWKAIDGMLAGRLAHRSAPTGLEAEVTAVGGQVEALGRDLGGGGRTIGPGEQLVLSQAEEVVLSTLDALEGQADSGPRLFTLLPLSGGWRHVGADQRFRLTLFCEHSRCPSTCCRTATRTKASTRSRCPSAGQQRSRRSRCWCHGSFGWRCRRRWRR